MADKVRATNKDSKFKPHDDGQFVGQCVDVVDLGPELCEEQDQVDVDGLAGRIPDLDSLAHFEPLSSESSAQKIT